MRQTTHSDYESDRWLTTAIDFGSAQTDTVLISGIAGFQIEIHSIVVNSIATAGTTELNEETTDRLIFKVYHVKESRGASGITHEDLSEGKSLLITCPANTFIAVTYHISKHSS